MFVDMALDLNCAFQASHSSGPLRRTFSVDWVLAISLIDRSSDCQLAQLRAQASDFWAQLDELLATGLITVGSYGIRMSIGHLNIEQSIES